MPNRYKGRTSIRGKPVCALSETKHPGHLNVRGVLCRCVTNKGLHPLLRESGYSLKTKCVTAKSHAFCIFNCLTNTPLKPGGVFLFRAAAAAVLAGGGFFLLVLGAEELLKVVAAVLVVRGGEVGGDLHRLAALHVLHGEEAEVGGGLAVLGRGAPGRGRLRRGGGLFLRRRGGGAALLRGVGGLLAGL